MSVGPWLAATQPAGAAVGGATQQCRAAVSMQGWNQAGPCTSVFPFQTNLTVRSQCTRTRAAVSLQGWNQAGANTSALSTQSRPLVGPGFRV
jgi:hypothetical protein